VAVVFEQQDAERLACGDGVYDTVVDTLGLCSCEDPRAVLREMQRVCKVLVVHHCLSTGPLTSY
jgi:ubiquinone/menaquinone biosynthesis C-methylase UbiE